MSGEALLDRVRMVWAMLADRPIHDARPISSGPEKPMPKGDEPSLAVEGFAEEALPWIDAVYSFSLRLVSGNRDAAEDLVQDTFLRAHRLREQREQPAADFDARPEALSAATAFGASAPDPENDFFGKLIDDEVVNAIDGLPEEFRKVLVLSDLGDLKYAEIAEVLDLPLGTVKSRLFRARKILQQQLRDFAVRSGYIEEGAS